MMKYLHQFPKTLILLLLLMLIGCGAIIYKPIPLLENDKAKLKTVFVVPIVAKQDAIWYEGKFANAYGGLISQTVAATKAQKIKLFLDSDSVNVSTMLYNKFKTAVNQDFLPIAEHNFNGTLWLQITRYGLTMDNRKITLENPLLPILFVKAWLKSEDNEIIWESISHFNPFSSTATLQSHSLEEFLSNPTLTKTIYNIAIDSVVSELIQNLNQ